MTLPHHPTRPVKVPPWDTAPTWREHGDLLRIEIAGTEVARYVDGAGSPAFDSPRPHLHPVRTPSGVVVTDSSPVDHTWHLGIGVGVQDVDGANLWGGRTYLPGAGYTWRQDHGRITPREWLRRTPGSVSHRLTWSGPHEEHLLDEVRELTWSVLSPRAWRLDLRFRLDLPAGSTTPVELGSPGSNGRERAGYGGLFWRLAPCRDVHVHTPLGVGEDAVHGSLPQDGAHWLAWSATTTVEGTSPALAQRSADVTVAIAPADPRTAADPWFVRTDGYPGIGSALAWDSRTRVGTEGLERSFTILVADGRWDDDQVEAALLSSRPDTGAGKDLR